MIIFVNCFTGIVQNRISSVTIVGWGSVGTVLGWLLWDFWVGQEEAADHAIELRDDMSEMNVTTPSSASTTLPPQEIFSNSRQRAQASSRTSSTASLSSRGRMQDFSVDAEDPRMRPPSHSYYPPYGVPASRFSPRNQARLATAKSALLIYCALLGLSPILKSLTKSTASDSIWAIGFWLMFINVVSFDYGAGLAPTGFPASLSTNAALMASTVLASRLPSTTHVFSLTLFSIEVFGLFPVFRRYLRHISWRGHCLLTWFLVMGAGGGTAVSLSRGGWKAALLGVFLGNLLTGLTMGLCSWWLIGLQQYKNEIHGPWDPARPIIKRRWD